MVNNSFNAYIVLDSRRKKADNSYPLKLRVVINRKSFHIALGHSVEEQYWNANKELISIKWKGVTSVKRLNNQLQKHKSNVLDKLISLNEGNELERLPIPEIKKRLLQKNNDLMILDFGDEVTTQLREAQKHGNARVYDTMLRSVRTFVKGKDFSLKQLSYNWLKKYEAWYLSKGNAINGLGVNMRTLRALFNRAIKQKRISQEYYPFSEYSIRKEATRKRAISLKDIEKLKQLEPQTTRHERAKDYFFISFYLMGASFVDIAFFKVCNIINGRIEYKRRKTGQLHSIPLFPPLQILLDKYLSGKKKEDFILNVIKSNAPKQQLVNVRDELRRFNRSLKEIGNLCGIEAQLTSYVSRHSYATIAKHKGVPTAVISEALGHTSEEVTQIYLDSFDTKILDNYHKMIIE